MALRILTSIIAFALCSHAYAQEAVSKAPMPEGRRVAIRVIPVVGASTFASTNSKPLNDYQNGFSAGVFGDFGGGYVNFETGVLTLNSRSQRVDNNVVSDVNSWGIPLLAKVNFTGRPSQTIFAKAGIMPFQATGDLDNEIDLLGLMGLGAAIPLTEQISLNLDGSYNHIVNNSSRLSNDFQGVSLLAGVSVAM